ncbi:predicted membrane protein involved in D-alanine export [Ruminococcus sp. CAG:353]|nr:predicted membrane protein involved in D-alanine export [Ruminococcus sp. CAG:353]
MVFSQLTFLYYFLPIVMIVYFFASDKIRNVLIFITGLFFYAWGEPFYVCLMLLSTAIDYTAGRLMAKYDDDNKKRKICLIVSVCMNVGLLAIFKYSDFLIDSFNGVFGTSITNPVVLVNKVLNSLYPLGLNEKRVELPIGISFYTFQSMSYTIDLYLRNIKVQKSFLNFASYVSLFPQIVAGPIVRYEDVANELESRTVNIAKISAGIGLFVKGLAKKVLLANNIGIVWTQIKAMDYSTISVATAWLGIIAFAFQIYFDFSGYSDMATGLGKMLGFEFPKNFDHPYISKSISEFWRRWHITLGSWFRSYVYIPLGGNRNGNFKTYRNLFITWALTGLWHGASWNFILWGLFFGVLIIIERLGFGKILEKLPSAVSMLYTFVMVLFGWVLFDTDTLADAGRYYAAMFGASGSLVDSYARYTIASNAVMLTLCILISGGLGSRLISFCEEKNKRASAVAGVAVKIGGLLICTAYLVGATYNPFLYFRF